MTPGTGSIGCVIIGSSDIGDITARAVFGFLQDDTGNTGVVVIAGIPGACGIGCDILDLILRDIAPGIIHILGFAFGFSNECW